MKVADKQEVDLRSDWKRARKVTRIGIADVNSHEHVTLAGEKHEGLTREEQEAVNVISPVTPQRIQWHEEQQQSVAMYLYA